jgi:hypothetical protein
MVAEQKLGGELPCMNNQERNERRERLIAAALTGNIAHGGPSPAVAAAKSIEAADAVIELLDAEVAARKALHEAIIKVGDTVYMGVDNLKGAVKRLADGDRAMVSFEDRDVVQVRIADLSKSPRA